MDKDSSNIIADRVASRVREAVSFDSSFVSKVNDIRRGINLLQGKRNRRLREMGYTKWLNPNQATVEELLDALVIVIRNGGGG